MRFQLVQLRLELQHLETHRTPHARGFPFVQRRHEAFKLLERLVDRRVRRVVRFREVSRPFVFLGVLEVVARGGEPPVDFLEAGVELVAACG